MGDQEAADDVDEAKTTAATPRIVPSSECCMPAASRAPTTVMPEIALEPDISGVWSVAGTFVITSKPTKIASTKIVRAATSPSMAYLGGAVGTEPCLRGRLGQAQASRTRGLPTSPPCVTTVSRITSSSMSSFSLPSLIMQLQQRDDVLGEHLAGVERHRGRQVHRAEDGDPVLDHGLAGRVSSQLPPCSAGKSTMIEPGCMAWTISP